MVTKFLTADGDVAPIGGVTYHLPTKNVSGDPASVEARTRLALQAWSYVLLVSNQLLQPGLPQARIDFLDAWKIIQQARLDDNRTRGINEEVYDIYIGAGGGAGGPEQFFQTNTGLLVPVGDVFLRSFKTLLAAGLITPTGDLSLVEIPGGDPCDNPDWNILLDSSATGDGSTDDLAEIQGVIDAAAPGDIIYFPPPSVHYRTSDPIDLNKQLTVCSDGWASGQSALLNRDNDPNSNFDGAHIVYDNATFPAMASAFLVRASGVRIIGLWCQRTNPGESLGVGSQLVISINTKSADDGFGGRATGTRTRIQDTSILNCVLQHDFQVVNIMYADDTVIRNTWMKNARNQVVANLNSSNTQIDECVIMHANTTANFFSGSFIGYLYSQNGEGAVTPNGTHIRRCFAKHSKHWAGLMNHGGDDFFVWDSEVISAQIGIPTTTGNLDVSHRSKHVGNFVDQTRGPGFESGNDANGRSRPRAAGWQVGGSQGSPPTQSERVEHIGNVWNNPARLQQAHWTNNGRFTWNEFTGTLAYSQPYYVANLGSPNIDQLHFGENRVPGGGLVTISGTIDSFASDPSAPPTPTSFTAVRNADVSVTLDWAYTESTNHDAFYIEYRPDGGSWTPLSYTPPHDGTWDRTSTNPDWIVFNPLTYTTKIAGQVELDPGVVPAGDTDFRIRAVAGKIAGSWSAIANVAT